jgi:DNA-binding GntR family transcriptional regulator
MFDSRTSYTISSVRGTSEPIARPEPLRTSVYRRLVGLMTGGELVPGQALTEAALSKALGVSRTPVREALLQLESEGVLQSTPARGFTVRELSATEATELFPILATLESLAVRTATSRPNLARLRSVDAELSIAEDPVNRWRLDTAFHEKLVEGCANASLRALITRLRVTLSRYEIEFMRRAGRHWAHASGSRHAAILDTLAARDLDGVHDAIARNWQDSLDAVRGWLTERQASTTTTS